MCGLCGVALADPRRSVDAADLERMTATLEHRGPDDHGTFVRGPFGLGFRRLSVIDLSERAGQPMVDKALGLVLVFNGTIYNYPELRKELQAKGHEFKSTGDTEVILYDNGMDQEIGGGNIVIHTSQ